MHRQSCSITNILWCYDTHRHRPCLPALLSVCPALYSGIYNAVSDHRTFLTYLLIATHGKENSNQKSNLKIKTICQTICRHCLQVWQRNPSIWPLLWWPAPLACWAQTRVSSCSPRSCCWPPGAWPDTPADWWSSLSGAPRFLSFFAWAGIQADV